MKRVFSIVTLLASSWAMAGPPTYSVKEITGAYIITPTALNNQGQVSGYKLSSPFNGVTHGFFYNGASLVDIPPLTGDTQSYAYGLNDAGVMVCLSLPSNQLFTCQIVSGTPKNTLLPAPPQGLPIAPIAINNAGTVMVNVSLANNKTGCYLLKGSTYIPLPLLPGGKSILGSSLNAVGLVAGYGDSPSSTSRAIEWAGGRAIDLGALTPGAVSQSNGVDNQYQVAGTAGANATLYSLGILKAFAPILAGSYASGLASNGQGLMIGQTQISSFGPPPVAFLLTNGIMTALDSTANANVSFTAGTLMNDRGQVVALSFDAIDTGYHTFLLTPTGIYATAGVADPSSGGSVLHSSLNPYGINVTLSAVANPGYRFTYWMDSSGIPVPGGPNLSLATGFDRLLVAHFTNAIPTFKVAPGAVKGGSSALASITLGEPAPEAFYISLASSDPSTATLPSLVPVAAGATSVSFRISTLAVSSSKTVTFTAAVGPGTPISIRSNVLTVNP